MGFLTPLFLLGGLLVALPVILHLTRRRREPVAFPSFLLLRMTSAAARWKRRRFRNLPLLILRCLALLLLASAFAQPIVEGGGLATSARAPLDLAVLVDRSLSMGVPGRMADAVTAAGEELGRLGRGDRGVVLAFDDRAATLTELTGDVSVLAEAVSSLAAGAGGTRFASALGLAGRLLPAAPGRRREVALISDLQQNGFEEGRPRSSLPPGVGIRVHRVGGAAPANAWISGVRAAPEGPEQITIVAELRFAPAPGASERRVEAELLLSGRVLGRETVNLAGNRTAAVRFAPILRPSDPVAAEVRLPGDALPGDDGFRFVIHPETSIRLADLGGETASVHVREALAVGLTPAFLPSPGPARGETAVARALSGSRVALVRDPGRLDAGAAHALRGFVASGGGLVMAMGPRRISTAAAAGLEALLPGLPAEFVDRDPPGRLGDFAARHPVFRPFGPEGSSPLGGTVFFRYRALSSRSPDAETIARFDDGSPALLAVGRGEGRVLLFTSSLDAEWTDLPRRPAFVPFLHRLIEVAAGYEEIPIAYRVGDSVDPAAAFRLSPRTGAGAGEVLVEAPSGARTLFDRASAVHLAEAGFFRARHPGSALFREIAVNPPLAESDLHPLDAEEVRIGVAAPEARSEAGAESADNPQAFGRPVWWILLGGLALLLAAEAWAANRKVAPALAHP